MISDSSGARVLDHLEILSKKRKEAKEIQDSHHFHLINKMSYLHKIRGDFALHKAVFGGKFKYIFKHDTVLI